MRTFARVSLAFALCCLVLALPLTAQRETADEFNDSHFHLTNYVQEGTDIREFLSIMGDKVGRVALFGIPLQQTWSHENSGDFAPTYYLQSDAPLYYYSFTDAFIAMAYKSLKPEQQRRLDPMITGFNPADMYAADHIRRVLQTFPGVFSGIGEFSIQSRLHEISRCRREGRAARRSSSRWPRARTSWSRRTRACRSRWRRRARPPRRRPASWPT